MDDPAPAAQERPQERTILIERLMDVSSDPRLKPSYAARNTPSEVAQRAFGWLSERHRSLAEIRSLIQRTEEAIAQAENARLQRVKTYGREWQLTLSGHVRRATRAGRFHQSHHSTFLDCLGQRLEDRIKRLPSGTHETRIDIGAALQGTAGLVARHLVRIREEERYGKLHHSTSRSLFAYEDGQHRRSGYLLGPVIYIDGKVIVFDGVRDDQIINRQARTLARLFVEAEQKYSTQLKRDVEEYRAWEAERWETEDWREFPVDRTDSRYWKSWDWVL